MRNVHSIRCIFVSHAPRTLKIADMCCGAYYVVNVNGDPVSSNGLTKYGCNAVSSRREIIATYVDEAHLGALVVGRVKMTVPRCTLARCIITVNIYAHDRCWQTESLAHPSVGNSSWWAKKTWAASYDVRCFRILILNGDPLMPKPSRALLDGGACACTLSRTSRSL